MDEMQRVFQFMGIAPHEYTKFAYALVGPDAELPGFSSLLVEHGFDKLVPRPPSTRLPLTIDR